MDNKDKIAIIREKLVALASDIRAIKGDYDIDEQNLLYCDLEAAEDNTVTAVHELGNALLRIERGF